MKSIACWEDLSAYGIVPLTGEACGLMYRILFDITEQGQKIIERCLDVKIKPADPWNSREGHIGSIMLSREMMVPLGIFALLESGCCEVWQHGNVLYGVDTSDSAEYLNDFKRLRDNMRRYAYGGTAGSRNVHTATNRVR